MKLIGTKIFEVEYQLYPQIQDEGYYDHVMYCNEKPYEVFARIFPFVNVVKYRNYDYMNEYFKPFKELCNYTNDIYNSSNRMCGVAIEAVYDTDFDGATINNSVTNYLTGKYLKRKDVAADFRSQTVLMDVYNMIKAVDKIDNGVNIIKFKQDIDRIFKATRKYQRDFKKVVNEFNEVYPNIIVRYRKCHTSGIISGDIVYGPVRFYQTINDKKVRVTGELKAELINAFVTLANKYYIDPALYAATVYDY